jgi:hypothetical protein
MVHIYFERKNIAAFLCFAAVLFYAGAQSVSDVRFVPNARISNDACTAEEMNADLFMQTALVASGVSESDMNLYTAKMEALARDTAAQISSGASESERASISLHYVYSSVLSDYSELQTRIDTALSTGVYNCVSSAVLFMYLMKKQGIRVTAVETPLHAFCVVQADGRLVDVETTNPWGFDPGKKNEAVSADSRKKYITVPAKEYAERHMIDDRRIIALIYNNRMVVLQRQKKDWETVGLACDAMKLQGKSPVSFNTFAQCAYNTAVDLSAARRDCDGLAIVTKAEQEYGSSSLYNQYVTATVGKMLNGYIDSDSFAEGFALLAEYKDWLSPAEYSELNQGFTANSVNHDITVLPFEEALLSVKNSHSNLSAKKYSQLLSYAYSVEANRIAGAGTWLDASALIDKGLIEVPGDSELTKQRTVYRQNYAVEIHNQAAMMFNSGDKDGARKVVEEGLGNVSENSMLKNDLLRIQKSMAR